MSNNLDKLDKQKKYLGTALVIMGVLLVVGGLYGWTVSITAIDKLMTMIVFGSGLLLAFLGKAFRS